MDYHDIPDYDSIDAWRNGYDELEMKLKEDGETVLHLVQATHHPNEKICDGWFYGNDNGTLQWVRERKGIEMPDTMDADYVELYPDGRRNETQHNHRHLDMNVRTGAIVPLKPVNN